METDAESIPYCIVILYFDNVGNVDLDEERSLVYAAEAIDEGAEEIEVVDAAEAIGEVGC